MFYMTQAPSHIDILVHYQFNTKEIYYLNKLQLLKKLK